MTPRALVVLTAALVLSACGPKIRPNTDAGIEDEDAGTDAGEVDAGRPRGDDPPTGYSIAVPAIDGGVLTRSGVSASLALDRFKQPLIASIEVDPNGDGVRQDDRLTFTRWNGTAKAFDERKIVEVIGQVNTARPHRQVSVAWQAETGRIAIAYVNAMNQVRFAYSDDEGTNFSQETVSVALTDGSAPADPVIAFSANNTLHLAYVVRKPTCLKGECGKVMYRKRTGTAAFADTEAPLTIGTAVADAPLSMVVDASGTPTLAYFEDTAADDTISLVAWSPGSSAGTVVADSQGVANDTEVKRPSVSLALSGTDVVAAFAMLRTDPSALLWYAKRAGGSWGTPVSLPRLPTDTTGNYQAVVAEAGGRVAVAGELRSATMVLQCGGPKLGRTTDGATFTVCHPPEKPATQKTFGVAGEFLSLVPHADGKLTATFTYDNRNNPLLGNKAGVVLYREP